MNPNNEIVQAAHLPPVIHMIVSGGGFITPYEPHEGKPPDVVGWFPNGTAAMGTVP